MGLMHGIKEHVGPSQGEEQPLPVGHSLVTTDGPLVVTFITPDGEPSRVFYLDIGQHNLLTPSQVHVVVDCDAAVRWSVRWPRRWNPSSPLRVAVPLVRPQTQEEELRRYVQQLVAQATGKDVAGAPLDNDDDFSEHDEEFGLDAPESIHQLQYMAREMELEARRQEAMRLAREREQKDIESEAPPVPLKTGAKGANSKPAPAGTLTSKPRESNENDSQ